MRYAERKKSLKWGKNRDPGYEYPSDIRLDEFENNGDDKHMEDNVNRMKKASSNSTESADEIEEEELTPQKSKSWWSYFLIHHYLH